MAGTSVLFLISILTGCLLCTSHASTPPNVQQCQQAIDLCFILDSSGSVAFEGWQMTQQFVNQIVNTLTVSQQLSRVGVVTFSTRAYLDIPLGQHFSINEVAQAVNRISFRGGDTNTPEALNLAANRCFRSSQDRPDVQNVAIVITDGNPTINVQTLPDAIRNLHSVTTVVATVAVGSTIDIATLAQIAKRSDGGAPVQNQDYFRSPTFNSLNQFVQSVSSLSCPQPPVPCRQDIDLCLILDSSNSQTPLGWRNSLQFATGLVRLLTVSQQASRVGVVTFSDHASLHLPLGAYPNSQALIQQINQLPYLDGWTNTAAALTVAATQCFGSSQDRPNNRNVAIFLSDGMPTIDHNRVDGAIQHLHSVADIVVSVGVGPAISHDMLARITKRQDRQAPVVQRDFFTSSSYANLPGLVNNLLGAFCPTPTPICDSVIDICFILDRSGSETENGWRQIQNYATQLIQLFSSTLNIPHYGVVTFSDFADAPIALREHPVQNIVGEINRIPFANGYTDLASALRLAATSCFRRRGNTRQNARNLAIVITDGNATLNQPDVPHAINALHSVAERVIAVGNGPNVIPSSIRNIARRQDDVYIQPRFDELPRLVTHVAEIFCPKPGPTPLPTVRPNPIICDSSIDICLILDRSGSETQSGWQQVQRYAVDLVQLFRSFSTFPQFGVVTFSDFADVPVELGQYPDSYLESMINRILFADGYTDLASALRRAATSCFRGRSDRRSARNVAIIITDGNATLNQHDVPNAITALHSAAERVISVGSGPNVIPSSLHNIARRPEDVYIRPQRNQLQNLVSNVAGFMCPGPTTPPTPDCQSFIDICLILDRSGSETPSGWQQVQRYALDLVQFFRSFSIFPQFGVITFSDFADVPVALGQYSDSDLQSRINRIRFADGYTDLASALRLAANSCFRRSGDRPDAMNLAIIITDGNATLNQHDVPNAIIEIHSVTDRVIAVGSGPNIIPTALHNIARRPADVYIRPRSDQLQTLVSNVAQFLCPQRPPTTLPPIRPQPIVCESLIDICLVLDQTGSGTPNGWQLIQTYAVDLIQLFRGYSTYPQFGVVTFSSFASTPITLGQYPESYLESMINQFLFAGGNSDLAGALRMAANSCFRGSRDRRNARNIAIIISDGRATINQQDVPNAINTLHGVADRVLTIGSGANVNPSSLHNIARRSDDVYIRPRRDQLQNLVSNVAGYMCPGTTPFPTPVPTPRPPVCDSLLDICLLLDRSGSETPTGWREVQRTSIDLLQLFSRFITYLHFGVVTFSDYAEELLPLRQYSSSYIESSIYGVPFADGYTDLPSALRLAATTCFRGRGDRPNARNVAIVISDANATLNQHDIPNAIHVLHSAAERVIVVGIGPNVVSNNAHNIARRPHDVYIRPNRNQLQNLVTSVETINCPPTPRPTPVPTLRPNPIVCQSVFDICFVLDRSGSETPAGWRQVQEHAVDLLEVFRRFSEYPYLGVVTFSDFAEERLPLGRHPVDTVRNVILTVPFADGFTDLATALRQAVTTCFSGRGRRSPDVRRVAIVISDGNATKNQHDVPGAIQQLHSFAERVISVGIGPNVLPSSLYSIARRNEDVYIRPNRNSLQNIGAALASLTCPGPGPGRDCTRSLDVCFILDSSSSVRLAGWRRILAFTNQFIGHLSSSTAMSHIGVVTFSYFVEMPISLGRHNDITRRVSALQFLQGFTNTAGALRMTANDCFSPFNDRPDNKNVAIFLSDGIPTINEHDVGAATGVLHSKADAVVSIGIGQEISQDLLRMIAKRPDRSAPQFQRDYFYTPNTQSLPSLLSSLLDAVCPLQQNGI